MHARASQSLLVTRRAPWARFLGLSAALHLVVVAGLVALQAWADRPPLDLNQKPIQASLVRLGTPRDPKLLPRNESPPPPAPEAPTTPPPPVPTAPPPPTPVPGVKPAVAPTKPAPHQDIAAKRAQLFGALSKYARASKPQELEGAANGDPNGDSARQEGERYWGLLSAQVHRNYDVSQTIPDDERRFLKAQVALRISRSGEVLRATLAHSSGNSLFDGAVLSAVKRASPLPPPPEALRERLQHEGVVLEFRP